MTATFQDDILAGLTASPKTLPSKHFYDAEGSRLFEAITALPEYYLTRTETALLARVAGEIVASLPVGAALVEFGSGSSIKTRLLLDAAPQLARYVPIDISHDALAEAAEDLRERYPRLHVEPVVGDFTDPAPLPPAVLAGPRLGFFPGSTLGNLGPTEQVTFLRRARMALGPGAAFLVGIDLVKPEAMLEAAYDDAAGVTAAFNKNLLARINRELGAAIDLDAFDHRAVWNADESRMEMHLVSRQAQSVAVAGRTIPFAAGESIHTENSYKFTLADFLQTAAAAGWKAGPVWTETAPAYALVQLEPAK